MRTLKFAMAAVAAFAFNANAQTAPVTGMGSPPGGNYQSVVVAGSGAADKGAAGAAASFGFHAGGVAACDGCHVMHNAAGGAAKSTTGIGDSVSAWSNVTNMYLLQGSDQSSTCLICHGGENMAQQFLVGDVQNGKPNTGPTNRTPGGDFGWLLVDYTNSAGQRRGHNVAAADFSMPIDTDLLVAPGGTWASGVGPKQFACSSCHDPHGRYRMVSDASKPNGVSFTGPLADSLPIAASGSYGAEPVAGQYAVGAYRLLAGVGYAPASNNAFPFPNDPPVAVAPIDYNRSEAATETRVAYGTGMSEWCQNCHTNIHLDNYTSGVAGLRHPAGSDAFLHAGQYDVYNKYVASGKVVAGATANYTSLVPFEQGKEVTLAALKTATASNSIISAGPKSAVMCLSCHRAHASAFNSMVRWDQDATFLTDAVGYTPGLTDRLEAVTQAGYYDREVGSGAGQLGTFQRSLCNKCHGKD